MLNVLLCVCLVLLLVVCVVAIRKHKEAKYYVEQWQKWEREYWLLRGSKAISDDYEVHLSWLPRGEDNFLISATNKTA